VRFIDVIVKNLVRRKTRAALTAAGLTAAVATSTASLSITWSYAGSNAGFYAQRGVDLVVVRAGIADRSTSNLNAAIVAQLAALPDVAAADGSLTDRVSFGRDAVLGIPLQGLDPAGFASKALMIVSGRALHADDRHQVLLGTALANSLGKKPGQVVTIEGTTFQVVGLFRSDDLLDSSTAVALLADVQELSEGPGAVSEIQVRMASAAKDDNDAVLRRLCGQIEALRDSRGKPLGLKALPTRQFVDSNAILRLSTATAWGTSLLAVVLSLLGMLNTMLMSVLERTPEFGMLRAVGWRRARIVRMILGESLLIGLAAALVGTAAAWCFVRVMAAWSVTQSIVNPQLSTTAVLCGVTIALAAGLIGSLYPAYRGATISPIEALRYE